MPICLWPSLLSQLVLNMGQARHPYPFDHHHRGLQYGVIIYSWQGNMILQYRNTYYPISCYIHYVFSSSRVKLRWKNQTLNLLYLVASAFPWILQHFSRVGWKSTGKPWKSRFQPPMVGDCCRFSTPHETFWTRSAACRAHLDLATGLCYSHCCSDETMPLQERKLDAYSDRYIIYRLLMIINYYWYVLYII